MQVAIVGAGPIGLEAAVEGEARGHEVVVYEAGQVADHVRRWGHVRLFTPWALAVTERGLGRVGDVVDDPDAFPTGAELVERYLAPLAGTLDVRTGHRVVGIGRVDKTKGADIGRSSRGERGFRLAVRAGDDETIAHADVVIDCGGVFGQPGPAGAGGFDAPGERALREAGAVRYGPVRVDRLAGKRVLLVGDGATAVTVLADLLALAPTPTITWSTPSEAVPGFVSPDDDALPARRALYDVGRAAPSRPEVHHRPGALVDRLDPTSSGVRVTFTTGQVAEIDAVVACTGFRPDHTLSRELQLHLCYASDGPMKLAAALLGANGGGGDCLAQPALGAAVLANPEPNFYVIGNKSYGRRADFLLKVGHQQVRDVFDLIDG